MTTVSQYVIRHIACLRPSLPCGSLNRFAASPSALSTWPVAALAAEVALLTSSRGSFLPYMLTLR